MQPYFLPYIGYWQLMAAVDTFVIYDNIKYTKKGWINRNRMLLNGEAVTFSLPLAKDSDDLDVVQRRLADTFQRAKLLAQLVFQAHQHAMLLIALGHLARDHGDHFGVGQQVGGGEDG